MYRLITIAKNTVRGFANPAFNFLIVVFGVKLFGKTDWASLIEVMLWVFFATFILSFGNYDYLLRKYSKNTSGIYNAFFSNLLLRSLLLPFTLVLILFFPITVAFWSILLIFLVFCYASFNTLVVYYQKFGAQLIAEILAFALIFGSLFYFERFNLITFLKLYCFATAIKLIYLASKFPFYKSKIEATVSIKEFKNCLPFFILGLSGWLISKIDIYLVDFFLEKSQLAEYQLLITAFIMLQALAAFIVIPFTKHVYRLPKEAIQKMKYKLYAVAFPLTCFGTFMIWVVMEHFVKLGFNYSYYILGFFIALPCFFYTINVMELIKSNKEQLVIYISFFLAFVNALIIFLLIKPYQIFGVLISVCLTQWIALVIYKYFGNVKKN